VRRGDERGQVRHAAQPRAPAELAEEVGVDLLRRPHELVRPPPPVRPPPEPHDGDAGAVRERDLRRQDALELLVADDGLVVLEQRLLERLLFRLRGVGEVGVGGRGV
jgi:hypothetical protein